MLWHTFLASFTFINRCKENGTMLCHTYMASFIFISRGKENGTMPKQTFLQIHKQSKEKCTHSSLHSHASIVWYTLKYYFTSSFVILVLIQLEFFVNLFEPNPERLGFFFHQILRYILFSLHSFLSVQPLYKSKRM